MIVVCGEALIDLFVGRPSAGYLPTEAVAGGSPFNVAIGMSRLGRQTAFLSTLSDDAFGAFLVNRLAEAGVKLDYLRRCSQRSTLSVVATGADGHPHYSFYAEAGADRALTKDDLPPFLPEDVNAIVAGSYALGVEPAASAIEALLHRESGRRVISLDPNVRPLVVGDVLSFRDRFEHLLSHATIVKASAEDIELFYGAQDVATVGRTWLEHGPKLVVITQGAAGPLALTKHHAIEHATPRIEVVDTVGAGDTFHAALLARLDASGRLTPKAIANLTADELRDVLDYATSAAALVCTRRGADCPTAGDVDLFMQSRAAA